MQIDLPLFVVPSSVVTTVQNQLFLQLSVIAYLVAKEIIAKDFSFTQLDAGK